ncbi:hypothetical protein [Luteolibacter sp. Populi]|uniref:hypothetical protein n=1 Tax=Luteolibacter sp. Populi TaxID=3230487 RepID=UPI003467830F
MSYQTTEDQGRWAANSKKRYGRTKQYYLELIRTQEGRCAFSGVPLLFDPALGTAKKGGAGCHALYAALDHTAAGCDDLGHGIVCYALNDIKGHLPHDCFVALRETGAWQQFMAKWRVQSEQDSLDTTAFYAIRHQRSA